jgi:hypothetical protein
VTAVLGPRHASCTSSAASTPAVSREIAASARDGFVQSALHVSHYLFWGLPIVIT